MKLPDFWVHIGHYLIKKEQFLPVANIPFDNKPLGGLWASPFRWQNGFVSPWHSFHRTIWKNHPAKKEAVLFTLKKQANVYIINSHEDLIRLVREGGEVEYPFSHLFVARKMTINFEALAEKYDVIYLTAKGERETKHPFENSEYHLYGWDCESCLILNMDAIDRQMPITLSF